MRDADPFVYLVCRWPDGTVNHVTSAMRRSSAERLRDKIQGPEPRTCSLVHEVEDKVPAPEEYANYHEED